jgi:hypothetical protein
MPKRTRIDVTPDKRAGGWVVKGDGEEHRFDRKADAVQSAAAAGRQLGNAQVVIRAMDGKIQSERTYGNDPRRSKG